METLVKGQSSLFIPREDSEGEFKAETSELEAVEPLQDGLEFSLSREEIERNTLTSTIEKVEPRLGLKTVTGSIPIEFKAGKISGAAPRGAILYESLLGGSRSVATVSTTKAFGSSHEFLALEDADALKYKEGDCVMVKIPGNFQVRPVLSVVTTPGASGLTLAIPLMTITGQIEIEKTTTYFHDKATPSFSAVHYLGGEIKEKIWGVKANSATIEGWSANQTPSIVFSVEGLDIEREVAAPTITPDFSLDSKVPVLTHACAWVGSEEVDYTELTLSMENVKADLLSACSPSGKIGTRKTSFSVSASINPYMRTDQLDRWEKFQSGAATSLFTYAFNPTVKGEFKEVVAIWMPNCKITNMPTADSDGVLMDAIEIKAFRKNGNDTIFLGFI